MQYELSRLRLQAWASILFKTAFSCDLLVFSAKTSMKFKFPSLDRSQPWEGIVIARFGGGFRPESIYDCLPNRYVS